MEKLTKKIIIFGIFLIGVLFLYSYLYSNFYLGDYIVQEQWINSSYEGKNYCDNCLWIRFSEGCNRYPVYYFKSQHEFDERLSLGKVVNINFRGDYIQGVSVAKKYRTKCFQEIDLTYNLGLFLIITILVSGFTYKIYKGEKMKSDSSL